MDGVVGKVPKRGRSSKKQFCKDSAVSVEKSASAIAKIAVEASVSTFSFVQVDGEGVMHFCRNY